MDMKTTHPTNFSERKAYENYEITSAISYLFNDFCIRRHGEELKKLIERKSASSGVSVNEFEKNLKLELTAQNFSNWTNNKVSINRDSALKIALTMHLDFGETEDFLNRCWHDGFYYRDYKDLVYIYCVENGYGYKKAEYFIKKYRELDISNPTPISSGIQNITKFLQNEYESLCVDDTSFEAYLIKNKGYFGTYRRMAYDLFCRMFDYYEQSEGYRIQVSVGDNIVDKDEKASYEEICEELAMGFSGTVNKNSNEILKSIAQNIPIRQTLSEIRNKTADKSGKIKQVPRKYLILIWMLLNVGLGVDGGSADVAEKEFIEYVQTLNCDILESCGMPKLDSRNPFDWIVLNSLRVSCFPDSKESEDAVERMQKFAMELLNKEMWN